MNSIRSGELEFVNRYYVRSDYKNLMMKGSGHEKAKMSIQIIAHMFLFTRVIIHSFYPNQTCLRENITFDID